MPTRREISLGLTAFFAAGAGSARASTVPHGVVAIGRAAMSEHPELLLESFPRKINAPEVRADFAAARVVRVDGWVLARHEVLWSIGQAQQAA